MGGPGDGRRTRGRGVGFWCRFRRRFRCRSGSWLRSRFWGRSGSWLRSRLRLGSLRGVGPGETGPMADAVLVYGLDPVHVALHRLHGAVGVAGRSRVGVGVDGDELASSMYTPVPPQHLVVGDAGVDGIVPGQDDRVVRRLGGQSRGLGRDGAVLSFHRQGAGNVQDQHHAAQRHRGQGDDPDQESRPTGESHRFSFWSVVVQRFCPHGSGPAGAPPG